LDASHRTGAYIGETVWNRTGSGIPGVVASGGGFSRDFARPVWAGIVAIADQYAGRRLGFINSAIYEIGRSARYQRAFHDVTKGNNSVQVGSVTVRGFDAGPGWDPVTGWGSPNAQVLIPLLARYATG
jgi:subtilase family serine protease